MHDCRLGFPSIAIWIASQHEQRREQVTSSTPRLSEEEQEERRKLDVPPSAAVPLLAEKAEPKADADGWITKVEDAHEFLPQGTKVECMGRYDEKRVGTVVLPLCGWEHAKRFVANGGKYRVVPQ